MNRDLYLRIYCLLVVLLLSGTGCGLAHEAGTSRFHLDIGEKTIETRFAFDLITILRVVPNLDRNRDGKISPQEAAAAFPKLASYLNKRVTLDIDGIEVDDWGKPLPIVWPKEESLPIGPAEYGKLLIQFPFQKKIAKRPKDLRVTLDVFVEFGGNHRIFGDMGIGQHARESIGFTHLEPDFLFDVAFALKKNLTN